MTEEGKRVDGRRARSIRSRAALVTATLELIESGDVRPTAASVAERAGLSVRSVFQHFADLEDLFLAVADRQAVRVAELFQPVSYEGDLSDRLDLFVARRARLHETAAPVRRATLHQEPFSKTVAKRMRFVRNLKRLEVMLAFKPELDAAEEAGDSDLVAAVVAATTWPVWEVSRVQLRLSVERASGVLRRTLEGLLGPYAQ